MKPKFLSGINPSQIKQCVGIDISKDKFSACLCIYDQGSDERCFTNSVDFQNDKQGFNQFVKWSRKEALKGNPISYLMEPTGVYYESLAYHLNKIGQTVYVVLPKKARDFANYEGIKTKTDAIDARCLALMGCLNKRLRPWTPPKEIYIHLRQKTRFNTYMNKMRTEVLNHMEALECGESADSAIKSHITAILKHIDKQLQKNEQEIIELLKSDKELYEKVKRLQTIKGLGLRTIACIIAETNGFALITSAKQLTSYAGLDAKAHQSGAEDPHRGISKQGNAHIRAALYMPGMVASRCNGQIKALYERICLRNTNTKMIGVVASMRKLLVLVYSLWKSGEVYDPMRSAPATNKKVAGA